VYLPIYLQSVPGPFLVPFIPVHSGNSGRTNAALAFGYVNSFFSSLDNSIRDDCARDVKQAPDPPSAQSGSTLQLASSPSFNFGNTFLGHPFFPFDFLQSTPAFSPFAPVHAGNGAITSESSSPTVAAGSGSLAW